MNNTTGSNNTAVGETALQNNSTGDRNTATGHSALAANTMGRENTAIGSFALQNSTGDVNTAVGDQALQNCTSGQGNIAIGGNAGSNVTTATAVICLGASAENLNNTTWISGIFGATVPGNAVQVFISPEGQLAAVSSSRRFKKEIRSMDKASESILALKPVTFHYKSDKTNTEQFGLIAEDVANVNPDLIVHDKNGEVYTVRYDAVNAMLLNEFLKEHQTVQELKKQVAELTAGLQKVSAQLELNKPARQTVLNDQ